MESTSQILPGPEASLSAASPTSERARWTDYYELTKPRMNMMVLITTLVGYFLALNGELDWRRLLWTLIGTGATAAGAAVLNQYAEREIDGRMPRTAQRPLPTGRIGSTEALALGVLLGALGIGFLALTVNPLTALLGAVTLGSYVFVYTPMKRLTTLCTIVGAVPGAIPPMMGFTAATGTLSAGAVALFAILFIWQMPHFLAIAILYRDDYAAGGLLMLPVADPNLETTGRQIELYSLTLVLVSILPFALGMAGHVYLISALLLGLMFVSFGVACAVRKRRIDARRLFLASIVYLPVLLAVMVFDRT